MQEPLFEINKTKTEDKYAKFELTPLQQGYGNTVGTALRRVLLSSIPGTAITEVKISGVRHQFSTLKGMKEDVLDLLLNLKKVRIKYDGEKEINLSLSAKGPGEVKAGDIQMPADAEIANPEFIIANLTGESKLDAKMVAVKSTGYSLAADSEREAVGVMPLDANYSPVVKVNYKVEETRVGRKTNYDKLNFEIWTDGTIDAEDALVRASEILVSYFKQIISPKEVEKDEPEEDSNDLGPMGHLSVEEIGLPTRVANALIKSGYETVEQLANGKKEDLMKVRNLGEKSIKIIIDALEEKGIEFSDA